MKGFVRNRGGVRQPNGSYRGGTWTAYWEEDRGPDVRHRQGPRGGFRTKKAAQDHLHSILSAKREGMYMAPSRTTFGAFPTETWLPAQCQRLRPSIFDDYDQRIHRHILPRLGRIEMQDLHALMLDQLYADLLRQVGPRGRPLAAKTVRNVHVIVRKALRDASRKRLVSRNVALDADPPKVLGLRERGLTGWSPEELTAFLTGIARHRLAPAFHLAASTGMRRGEVLGVRWCDVDLVLEPHMGAPDGKPRIRRRLWNERREPENGQRRWPVVERPPPPRCLSGLHGRQLLQITTQKRHRLQATTAQNTDKDPIWPQSMATTSPGTHPPGRRIRR